jgi:hypothetical protein
MSSVLSRAFRARARQRSVTLLLCTAAVLASLALAPRARSDQTSAQTGTPAKPIVSASVVQCVTSVEQAERAATFQGEMSAIPGTAKMQMRIDVFERAPHELSFHAVLAPGLGVWRTAATGVKTYRYLKEVTNLGAPAYYRAAVRFRWLNGKDRLIQASELRTPKCLQPAAPPSVSKPGEETPPAS